MSLTAVSPRIQILPDTLASQIAAGEVIERPASVIKELLENSIDAGATDIRVEVEAGGCGLIRVRDNGHGIHRDDLVLAVQSHATSKIRAQADLHRINSLGFRGEALSSIASVSQFQLTSRQQDAGQAWQISADPFSGAGAVVPAAHAVGTTVEVHNLFHATPARRKFLRSERTEFLHILEMIRRIALSRFDLAVRLLHNGRQVFHCRADQEDPGGRIKAVMGGSFSEAARVIDQSSTDMRLWGWLGTDGQSRSQTDRQYFYFNGRIIRDRQVNHAIRLAYEGLLPTGRYPSYVLYLQADPAAADVNVHPTKYEIRFRNARDVHDFIHTALSNILSGENRLFDRAGGEPVSGASPARPAAVGGAVREVPDYYTALAVNRTARTAPDNAPAAGLPVARLYGRFALSRRGEHWLLTDIHQARRHIVRYRMGAVTEDAPVRCRPLLVPVVIPVTAAAADLVDRYSGLLGRYGLGLERNAPESIVVRHIPALMPDVELQPLLQDILTMLGQAREQAGIPEALVTVLVAHACDGLTENLSDAGVLQVLRSLADTGIDMDRAAYPGIWKTLDSEALAELLAEQ